MTNIFLSLFYYHKKNEDKEFFDAWWQFIYRLEFYGILLFLTLVNFIFTILKIEINVLLFPIAGGLFLFISYLFNDYRETNFNSFITSNYDKIKPIPKWILFLIEIFIILFFAYSISVNIDFVQ